MSHAPGPSAPKDSNQPSEGDGLVEVPAHVVGGILLGLVVLAFLAYQSLVKREHPAPAEGAAPVASPPQSAPRALPPVDAVLGDSTSVKEVHGLRGLPQAQLEQLVRGGTPIQRTSALSVLWARGQRDLVRGMAAGDALLEAQLVALEQRAP